MKITPVSPSDASAASGAYNTWVLPEQKILFVSIGKNACTSIKWLLAEISGQDIDQLLDTPALQSTRRMLIHTRKRWVNTPKLSEMTEEQRAQISPDNGWFVFAVVRDPRLRIFSAWQSKFLVGEPAYSWRKYGGRAWIPSTPESKEDVLRDWEKFVTALELDGPRGGVARGDGHFTTHTARLHEAVVPYGTIYDMSEIGQLTTDLREHLIRTQGHSPELLLGNENDTPLKAGREVFENGILDRLEVIYASDFERFGDLWDESFERKVMAKPVDWTAADFREIASRRAINERVYELDMRIRGLAAKNRELRADLQSARAELTAARDVKVPAPTPTPSLASKVKRRLTAR
ncbi:sulfotransferase family 2 domain-containing protein [Demequina soli]|uniref:sulfotransferase family 2 domain-containing protein n=1 Tax=Demequina soli TaxID=1638987 RepID=UPI0007843011|nr:sulfotransferase family 2 domain-containing protein [Demequina soli]